MKIKKSLKENPEYNYKMIVLARESRGLGQQELAEMIGTNAGNLSRIEKGTQTIMQDMIEKICKALDYPLHFFKQEKEAMDLTSSYYRKKMQLPKKELLKAEAQMNIYGFNIEKLLESVELLEPNYPRFDLEKEGTPEQAAQYVRQFWEVSEGRIENLVDLLEDNGILVVNMDFEGASIDGLSIITANNNPIIFINRAIPADRYRLTLAHEFGHLVLHIGKEVSPERDTEKEAFLFGAELLMPGKEIKEQLYDLDIEKLKTLKPLWKISMGALIKRAQVLGTITDNQYQYLWKQMTKLGYKKREPEELDFPREQPTLLKEMIDKHIEDPSLEYSEAELAMHLCLNLDEFKEKFLNKTRLRIIR